MYPFKFAHVPTKDKQFILPHKLFFAINVACPEKLHGASRKSGPTVWHKYIQFTSRTWGGFLGFRKNKIHSGVRKGNGCCFIKTNKCVKWEICRLHLASTPFYFCIFSPIFVICFFFSLFFVHSVPSYLCKYLYIICGIKQLIFNRWIRICPSFFCFRHVLAIF